MQKTSVIIALSLAAVLAGCVSSEQRPTPKLASTDRRAALHVVEGTKLRDSIHRLHSLRLSGTVFEPELDSKRRQVASQAMEVVDGTESMLDNILAVKPELNLDADKQKLFDSHADNLRAEVKTLKTQIQTFQLNDIPATLDRMDVTCTSCHELFPNLTIDPAS